MKLTPEQQAEAVREVMSERGKKGGKKRWEGKTSEEKRLYALFLNERIKEKRSKAAMAIDTKAA